MTRDLVQASGKLVRPFLGCDGAILKSRSRSCALRDAKVYRSFDKPHFLCRDSGIFGAFVMRHLGHKAVDDEQRLTNLVLREHFLIRLYVWARFRNIAGTHGMGDLVEFHARHKLLFLAYNQSRFRMCGRIAANQERLPPAEVYKHYEKELSRVLNRPFRRRARVNTLYHALGWVSEHLSEKEKMYIINTIEEYRDERIPLPAVTRLLEIQDIRFDSDYLFNQVLLRPFPSGLIDLSDSGKGREVK